MHGSMRVATLTSYGGTKLMAAETLKVPAPVGDAFQETARITSMVSDAVETGVRTALKSIKQGRHVAEDAIEDAKHATRRNPLQALTLVFAAGLVAGSFLTWVGSRLR
jgi:hypothetical protein